MNGAVTQRFRHLVTPSDARAGKSELPLLSVSARLGVVRRSSLTDAEPRADDLSIYKVCRAGDWVLNRMSAYQGALGIAGEDGIVSPDYLVARPSSSVDGRYLHHLTRSTWFVGEMSARLRGIGSVGGSNVRTPRVNWDDLGDIEVALPPVEVQLRVADFLDDQVTLIDHAIALRHRQAALIAVRLQSRVDALAEGSAPLVKAATVLRVLPGYAFASGEFADDEGSQLLRGVNVGVRRTNWDDTVCWEGEDPAVTSRFSLSAGDVVLGMDRPWIGAGLRIACLTENDLPALLLQRVARLVPGPRLNPHYMFWVYQSERFRREVEGRLTGLSVPHLSGEQIQSFRFPLPELPLQALLAEELDDLVRQVELTQELLAHSARLLLERKQALITAAVTGEFDVTTASARGVA
jgi:type I restriction enzyme S subunit